MLRGSASCGDFVIVCRLDPSGQGHDNNFFAALASTFGLARVMPAHVATPHLRGACLWSGSVLRCATRANPKVDRIPKCRVGSYDPGSPSKWNPWPGAVDSHALWYGCNCKAVSCQPRCLDFPCCCSSLSLGAGLRPSLSKIRRSWFVRCVAIDSVTGPAFRDKF